MSIEILKERLEEAQDENLTNARVLTVDLVSALEDIAKLQERAKTAIHYYAEIDNLKGQLEHKERQLAEAEARRDDYKTLWEAVLAVNQKVEGDRRDAEARVATLEKAARNVLVEACVPDSPEFKQARQELKAALSDGGEREAK